VRTGRESPLPMLYISQSTILPAPSHASPCGVHPAVSISRILCAAYLYRLHDNISNLLSIQMSVSVHEPTFPAISTVPTLRASMRVYTVFFSSITHRVDHLASLPISHVLRFVHHLLDPPVPSPILPTLQYVAHSVDMHVRNHTHDIDDRISLSSRDCGMVKGPVLPDTTS
jgi:hypothetical protein